MATIKVRKLFYSSEEFARITGLPVYKVRKLARDGTLPLMDNARAFKIDALAALAALGFEAELVEDSADNYGKDLGGRLIRLNRAV